MATRDGYYLIDITWKTGFKHTVACRGYNLKSEITFNKSIFWIEDMSYREVTQEEYELKAWGPPIGEPEPPLKPKRKKNDKPVPAAKRAAKARAPTKASAKTSKKVTPAKRSTKEVSKPNGEASPPANKRKPRSPSK